MVLLSCISRKGRGSAFRTQEKRLSPSGQRGAVSRLCAWTIRAEESPAVMSASLLAAPLAALLAAPIAALLATLLAALLFLHLRI